jgi:hypothetical protein
LDNLFQRVPDFELFAAESRFFRHDEHLKRCPRFQRVHQSQKAGTIGKFRAADAVITEDEPIIDGPAFPRRILARVIELARDGF